MEELRNRIALLYDADNVSSMHARRAAAIAEGEGELVAFRAYGHEAVLGALEWDSVSRELGAQLIACPAECYGKNAADILIVIDAMDMLAAGSCDSFVIASNDSDFLSLARRLRAAGKRVVGVGTRERPAAYRGEFDAYHVLVGHIPQARVDEAGVAGEDELVSFLSHCLHDVSEGEPYCSLSRFSNRVLQRDPALSPKRYGYPTLKKLVLATGAFDIRQVRGGDFVIRAKE